MHLSIVVTTRNRFSHLLLCIKSIIKNEYSCDYELIIIDDASIDKTKDIQPNDIQVENIQVVHNIDQVMMVRARNQGAKLAKGNYILFIDDDNEIDEKMIKCLMLHFDRYPEVGIVGPSMYHQNSQVPYLTAQKINLYTGRTRGLTTQDCDVLSTDGVPNVFMIRKSVLEKLNYFDEQIVQTFTEPDFAFKARKFGIKCEMILAAKTYHNKSWGGVGVQISKNNFSQKAYYIMRNRILFVSRYGSLRQKIIFNTLFSWMWPIVYSLIAIRYLRKDLIALYWMGFVDGIKILMTGNIDNNEVSVARVRHFIDFFSGK